MSSVQSKRLGSDDHEEPRSDSKAAHARSAAKIAARAANLIAEEKSLQELRQAHKLTQKRMAQVLGIGQDSVSRLEQRSDLLISTLRGYVEALGGRLSLVAEFPNQEPVILSGIAALDGDTVEARTRAERDGDPDTDGFYSVRPGETSPCIGCREYRSRESAAPLCIARGFALGLLPSRSQRLSAASQFRTTVIGVGASGPAASTPTKRLPSSVTASGTGGVENRRFGALALNDVAVGVTSTAITARGRVDPEDQLPSSHRSATQEYRRPPSRISPSASDRASPARQEM